MSTYPALKQPVKPSLVIAAPSAYLIGGVQTWLDYLVPGLDSTGWDVTVLLVDGICSDANLYLKHHPFAKTRLVSNPTGSREGRVRSLVKSILAEAPDLVLGVNIADVFSAVARIRRAGDVSLKVAMAIHGLQPCFYRDVAKYKSIIDGVICTNRLAVAAAIQLGGTDSERAHYAPCGVIVPKSPVTSIVDEKLTLLYAGRFDTDEKRVMDLPHILAALDQRKVPYRLRLAGAGPAEEALRNALAKFGDKVEFLGVLNSGSLLRTFYTPGAVLLILSPSETGPLVAWEAMANGVALVTSRFAGIGLEGSLRDGKNCLTFPVGDTEMAANAVAQLEDPSRRLALLTAGYFMVEKRYNREFSIKNWDHGLRQILALQSLPAGTDTDPIPAAGRLDRTFRIGPAESLRSLFRTRFIHSQSGDEWPHSYSSNEDANFFSELAEIDQPAANRSNEQ